MGIMSDISPERDYFGDDINNTVESEMTEVFFVDSLRDGVLSGWVKSQEERTWYQIVSVRGNHLVNSSWMFNDYASAKKFGEDRINERVEHLKSELAKVKQYKF